MIKSITIRFLTVFVLACSTTAIATSDAKVASKKTGNIINYVDLTKKDGVILTLEEQEVLLEKFWQLSKIERYVYKKDRAKRNLSGCVQFLITLNAEGKMSTYGILKSYPKGFFDKQAISKLNALRWQATKENYQKLPVLTTIQLDLGTYRSTNKEDALNECDLKNRYMLPSVSRPINRRLEFGNNVKFN